jgi:hypothetical protein
MSKKELGQGKPQIKKEKRTSLLPWILMEIIMEILNI